MGPEIIIHNVELLSLRERIIGYKLLFNVESIKVQVKGIFKDRKGEIAFLDRKFCELDVASLGRYHYIPIFVNRELLQLKPLDDIIQTVKIGTL